MTNANGTEFSVEWSSQFADDMKRVYDINILFEMEKLLIRQCDKSVLVLTSLTDIDYTKPASILVDSVTTAGTIYIAMYYKFGDKQELAKTFIVKSETVGTFFRD